MLLSLTPKKGYSLVELIIAVIFVAVIAAIAVPRVNFSITTAKGAEATARKIATDLRRTRQLAIADAAENSAGYRLRMNGSSPFKSYDIVNLKTSEVVDSHTIPSGINCNTGSNFRFGPMGNLLSGSDSLLNISGDNTSLTITITSATGMIKCTEN